MAKFKVTMDVEIDATDEEQASYIASIVAHKIEIDNEYNYVRVLNIKKPSFIPKLKMFKNWNI